MTFSDGVTQLALAKNLGVSRAQVRTLIDKGIFKTDEAKRVSLSAAVEAYKQYQKNIDQNKRSKSRKAATKLIDEIKSSVDVGDDFESTYKNWLGQIENNPIAVLNAAKAYMTAVQTKQEKLKLDELEGRLYSIDRINADAEKIGLAIKSKFSSLPARIATVCEGRTARDIEEIISDEINNCFAELQKLFIK
ncbi:hypothetical protein [Succinivibrio sp.]|uniref:hypothetical protein n=1 Tax=Succinivibrio sp. TaxID=2053619 RepID=UPI0038704E1E|nr:hypothetical protein [Succinivibrio sp.]